MPATAILWRRLDQPGHDAACLVPQPDGYRLAGSAVFVHRGAPVRLDYVVLCDTHWQTRSARIRGCVGASPIGLDLTVDAGRRWYHNATECPAVAGCVDIDLGFSPVTNLLPIRRLELAVGDAVDVQAAWLGFPSLTLEPLDQRYRRSGPLSYHYESAGGQFQSDLEVNAAGFVIHYPGLWQAEASA